LITFKLMRIITPVLYHVNGIGRVWIVVDSKYDEIWARRYEH